MTRRGRAAVREAIVAAAPADPHPVTDASDPALSFGPYEMRCHGLYRRGKDHDRADLRLCGPFEILAEVRDKESEGWGLRLRWRDRDGTPKAWTLPRAMLAGEGAAVRERLLSGGFDISTRRGAWDDLRDYLAQVRSPRRGRTVERTGWHALPERQVFVLPDAVFPTDDTVAVFLDSDGHNRHAFSAADSAETWREAIGRRCVGNTRLVLGVSLAFAAPLAELLGESGGGINLVGHSREGKTTVLRLAASVFGRPQKYMGTWKATDNALEATAERYSDLPLILDEMGEVHPEQLGQIAYMLANGKGKARAAAAGGASAKTYVHADRDMAARPEIGAAPRIRAKAPPTRYRYDSLLSPALEWDTAPARELGAFLLGCIEAAAKLPPPHMFPALRELTGADGSVLLSVSGLQDAIAALKRLERPFLDWAGKAERTAFEVPTLPLFVHERLSTAAILESLKAHEKQAAQADMFSLFADPRRPLVEQVRSHEHGGRDPWANSATTPAVAGRQTRKRRRKSATIAAWSWPASP